MQASGVLARLGLRRRPRSAAIPSLTRRRKTRVRSLLRLTARQARALAVPAPCVGRRRWSQDLLMTADIDAKLPETPSLEGYRVEVLSLDSVVHFVKTHGNCRDQFAPSHRAALRASESESGKQLAPK
jgi:hypothetical protein